MSNSGNPPNGNTGAPGDGMCANCHSGGAGIDGNLTISGLPSSIAVNTDYSITVSVENITGADKGGFQLVALDQSNNNVGTLSSPGPSSTLQSSGGRTYFEHNPAKSFTGPGTVTYTITWKSPNLAAGQTVTMYAASILANGNGNSSGDLQKLDQIQGTMPGPPPVQATISAFKNVTCGGGADGSLTVSPINGLPPYTFLWSDGQTTATALGLTAKMYTVTVTDNANNTASTAKLITEPPVINLAVTGKKDLKCFGDKDGSITVNSSGGTGAHQYKWNTGATTKTIANLSAGIYTVTVTDNVNCTSTEAIEITQPDILMLELSNIIHPICAKDSSGSALVVPSGGTPNYTYNWSTGNKTALLENKPQGTYTVTVTDKNLCTKTISVKFNVQDNQPPLFNHWKDSTSYRCDVIATNPRATDNCGIKEIQLLEGINIGDTFKLGTTRMRYRAIDLSNNSSEYSYTVTINNPIKFHVDTFTYDTCSGKVNWIQIKMNHLDDQFYDLYFNAKKINRYDTAFLYQNTEHSILDTLIIMRDSFNCKMDTILKLEDQGEYFTLDSFTIKNASECKLSDGEIILYMRGKLGSSFWINEKGDTLINSAGKNFPAGKYYFYASSGLPEDSLACFAVYGPFEVLCTTGSNRIEQLEIQIYPTLANDFLNIKGSNESTLNLNIYHLDGSLFLRMNNYNTSIPLNISHWPSGIYFLQLSNDKFRSNKRIVVNH